MNSVFVCSERCLFHFHFWKIDLLGIEFWVDSVFLFCFFKNTLKMWVHFLLACIFSDEKWAVIVYLGSSVYNVSVFPLAVHKTLTLVFSDLSMIYPHVSLFCAVYPVQINYLSFLDLWFDINHYFWKIFSHYISKYFCPILSSPFEIAVACLLGHWLLCHIPQTLSFFLFSSSTFSLYDLSSDFLKVSSLFLSLIMSLLKICFRLSYCAFLS